MASCRNEIIFTKPTKERTEIRHPSGSREDICPVCKRRFAYTYGSSKVWQYKVPVRDARGKRRMAKACSWNCLVRYQSELKLLSEAACK